MSPLISDYHLKFFSSTEWTKIVECFTKSKNFPLVNTLLNWFGKQEGGIVDTEASRCVGWYLMSKWGGTSDGEVYSPVSTAFHETLWFWQGSNYYGKGYKGSWNWEIPHIFQLSPLQQVNWWLNRQVLQGSISLSPCVGLLVGWFATFLSLQHVHHSHVFLSQLHLCVPCEILLNTFKLY